jgi:hypothetical protein
VVGWLDDIGCNMRSDALNYRHSERKFLHKHSFPK